MDEEKAEEIAELVKDLKNGKKYKFDPNTKELAKKALSKISGMNHKHTEAIFAENELDKIEKKVDIEKGVKKIAEEAEDNGDDETLKDAKKVLKKVGSKSKEDDSVGFKDLE